jgi:hypothetical protein
MHSHSSQGRGEIAVKPFFSRVTHYAGITLVVLCILVGIVSFVQIGEVLGEAVGAAYSAPEDMSD